MKISQMDPQEAGERMLKLYLDAHRAYDADEHGDHPSSDLQRWADIASSGGENSEERIQSQDEDETVQPKKSAGGNSGSGGATPAQDGRFTIDGLDGTPKFERADGTIVTGDRALVEHAAATDPRKVRGMKAAIKGY